MILIRAIKLDFETLSFAKNLQTVSQHEVIFIVDERKSTVDTGKFRKISLNASTCQDQGLYTPTDFAWRCGDYGFYLARKLYPAVNMFWMLDYDVRIVGDATKFFKIARAHSDIDLLATFLCRATKNWWWYPALAANNTAPWRCFFPVIRLSAQGIDCLLEKRRTHSLQLRRRMLWPNDESFVATTILNSGLNALDINDIGEKFYESSSFSFDRIIDGNQLNYSQENTRLIHPVLTGLDLTRKQERLSLQTTRKVPFKERLCRRFAFKINSMANW